MGKKDKAAPAGAARGPATHDKTKGGVAAPATGKHSSGAPSRPSTPPAAVATTSTSRSTSTSASAHKGGQPAPKPKAVAPEPSAPEAKAEKARVAVNSTVETKSKPSKPAASADGHTGASKLHKGADAQLGKSHGAKPPSRPASAATESTAATTSERPASAKPKHVPHGATDGSAAVPAKHADGPAKKDKHAHGATEDTTGSSSQPASTGSISGTKRARPDAAPTPAGPGKRPRSDSAAGISISDFLKTGRGAVLGTAQPIVVEYEEDSDADSDDSDNSVDEDERVLALRALQAAEAEDEDDRDWLGRYEPESDVDSEDDSSEMESEEVDDEADGAGDEEDEDESSEDESDEGEEAIPARQPAKANGKAASSSTSTKLPAGKAATGPKAPLPSATAPKAAAPKPNHAGQVPAQPKVGATKAEGATQAKQPGKAATGDLPPAAAAKSVPATKSEPTSKKQQAQAPVAGKPSAATPSPPPSGKPPAAKQANSATLVAAPVRPGASNVHAVVLPTASTPTAPAPVSGVKRPHPGGEAEGAASATESKPVSRPEVPQKKHALPKAFVPGDSGACVWVGNVASETSTAAIQEALKQFGAVKTVHIECNNNGKPAGFGYVEFKKRDAAQACIDGAASVAPIGDRALKLSRFTPESNYRNPDGTRRRTNEKKLRKQAAARQLSASGAGDRPTHAPGAKPGFQRGGKPKHFHGRGAHGGPKHGHGGPPHGGKHGPAAKRPRHE